MRLGRAIAVMAALGFALAPAAGRADTRQLPVLDIGVFGLAGYVPDYPAASQSHLHLIPLPYLIYRGKYFETGPNSAAGYLFKSPAYTLDISAAASFDTQSTNDLARQGMPALGYLGEIGPRLRVRLLHDAASAKIDLEFPVRAVLETDLKSIGYEGFDFTPEIAYQNDNFYGSHGRFKIGLSPQFASQQLMSYFYGVSPQFATATRPAYTAQPGYVGTQLDASYRVPLNARISLFSQLAFDDYTAATNQDSPLFRRQYGASVLAGVSFSLWHSKAMTSASGN